MTTYIVVTTSKVRNYFIFEADSEEHARMIVETDSVVPGLSETVPETQEIEEIEEIE